MDKKDKIAIGIITQPPLIIRSSKEMEGALPVVAPVESAAVVICRNKFKKFIVYPV
jgi:hypothetical protein